MLVPILPPDFRFLSKDNDKLLDLKARMAESKDEVEALVKERNVLEILKREAVFKRLSESHKSLEHMPSLSEDLLYERYEAALTVGSKRLFAGFSQAHRDAYQRMVNRALIKMLNGPRPPAFADPQSLVVGGDAFTAKFDYMNTRLLKVETDMNGIKTSFD